MQLYILTTTSSASNFEVLGPFYITMSAPVAASCALARLRRQGGIHVRILHFSTYEHYQYILCNSIGIIVRLAVFARF
jgi:hypothetical protein